MFLSSDLATVQNLLENPKNMPLLFNEIYSSFGEVQAQIGSLTWTMLDLPTYSGLVNGEWQACDGSPCVGTAYEALTTNATVPNTAALITIGNVFIRVN